MFHLKVSRHITAYINLPQVENLDFIFILEKKKSLYNSLINHSDITENSVIRELLLDTLMIISSSPVCIESPVFTI